MRKKREKIKLTKESYQKAKNFLTFIKPYRGVYIIGFIFLILSSSVSVALPYLLGKVLGMDRSKLGGDWDLGNMDNIYSILLILAIALPSQALFSFFRIYTFSWVTQNSLKDIRDIAFKKLIKAPIAYFDQNKVGELSSRVATDINLLQETLTTTIAEFFRQIFVIIVGLILIFYASTQLALTMLMVIPVVAVAAMLFGKYIKGLSKETQDEAAKSNNVLEEALAGIKSLKAYTNEFFELKKYQTRTLNIKKIALKAALWRGLFVGFILFVMFGAIVFVIWRGIELVNLGPENGGINNESFFQFILMTVMLGASIGSVPDMFAKIQKSIGATESLMDIINNESEEVGIDKPADKYQGNIQFNDVSFSYPTRKDVSVLNKVSFTIPSGEQLAIVGGSGSGKSTIANLILQFYQPKSGEIIFDGKSSAELGIQEIRKNIAYVPQEIMLLGGTILENILYGNPTASFEEVKLAAQKANALEFIEKFPEKFETMVGDRGIQLSGGQRQRIAIARAILRDPSILILDEATSALDNESESLVQDALEKLMKGRTSIVIAHRLSTIKNANKILVLENGEVVEIGSHQELMANQNGRYHQLTSTQLN